MCFWHLEWVNIVLVASIFDFLKILQILIVFYRCTKEVHQADEKHYIKPNQLMFAGFRNFDPGVQKKLAFHPDLPQAAVEWGTRARCNERQCAVADLVNVVFYFLL